MRRIDDRRFKGLPLGACLPVSRIGHLGWNALRDLEYPVLLLHQKQPGHNITTMADYGRPPSGRASSARQDLGVAVADPATDGGGRLGGDSCDLGAGQGVCWLSESHVFCWRTCSSILWRSAGS
jgi:hypothetical protein